MTGRLGDAAWPDVASRTPVVVAVPVGSCEQHGPHLPLDTDTRIAVALTDALARRIPEVVGAPALTITASGEHAGFPGTLSIGAEALTTVVLELVRSADWADGVVLVNGHGGNIAAVDAAVRVARRERRHVLPWWPLIPEGDAHAGEAETSLMLAIAPEAVRMERAEAGRTEPLAQLMPALMADGMRSVAPNGVLGDPRRAGASAGHALLARLVDDLEAAVRRWR